MRKSGLIVLAMAALPLGIAAADDNHPVYLTFNVPVKLDTMEPGIKKFGVSCAVCEGDQCDVAGNGLLFMSSNVEHDFPTTPGPHSFDGTVSVPIAVDLTPKHHKLSTYSCHLYLKTATAACIVGTSQYQATGVTSAGDPDCKPWNQPQPNTVFVGHLQGDLAIDVDPPAQMPSEIQGQASSKPVLPSLNVKPVVVNPVPQKK